jgi:hypothetical protein
MLNVRDNELWRGRFSPGQCIDTKVSAASTVMVTAAHSATPLRENFHDIP